MSDPTKYEPKFVSDDKGAKKHGSGIKLVAVAFTPREVRLIRALEQVANGRALGENSRVNWDLCRDVARRALAAEGWPVP